MISISGLSKAAVLAALYNSARPLGMGFMHYDPKPMTELEAEEILKSGTYFDYLKGRVMKVDLSKDEFNEYCYDRDNGLGTAMAALRSIQLFDDTDNPITRASHDIGTSSSIADVEERLETDQSHASPGHIHLGLADMAEHLKPKIEEVKKNMKLWKAK